MRWRGTSLIFGASGWAAVRGFFPLIPSSAFLLLFLNPLRLCCDRRRRCPEWFSFSPNHARLLALPRLTGGEDFKRATL